MTLFVVFTDSHKIDAEKVVFVKPINRKLRHLKVLNVDRYKCCKNVYVNYDRGVIRFIFRPFELYRPGQPDWEYTMWQLQNFSATQILREINLGHFEAPKNCHFEHLSRFEF